MKKIILIILFFLFCFKLIKAQELTIDDLQKAVIAMSIDRADSLLRLKGYRLIGIPEEGDKDSTYIFEKGRDLGNYDIVYVHKNIEEAGTYKAFVMYDDESKFYRLKKECEKLREIQKIDEFSESGGFFRRYCDRFFTYTFLMKEEIILKRMMYTVFVAFHRYPCQKPK